MLETFGGPSARLRHAFCALSARLWRAIGLPLARLRLGRTCLSFFFDVEIFFHISERWCSNSGSEGRFGAYKKMKILVFTAYERSKRVSTRCLGKKRNLKCQPFVLDQPRPPQNRHVSQISERWCSNFGLERRFGASK